MRNLASAITFGVALSGCVDGLRPRFEGEADYAVDGVDAEVSDAEIDAGDVDGSVLDGGADGGLCLDLEVPFVSTAVREGVIQMCEMHFSGVDGVITELRFHFGGLVPLGSVGPCYLSGTYRDIGPVEVAEWGVEFVADDSFPLVDTNNPRPSILSCAVNGEPDIIVRPEVVELVSYPGLCVELPIECGVFVL